MNTNFNGNTNNESETKCNYISSKISIDFFVQQVKIYITIPQHVIDKILLFSNEDYTKQIKLTHNIELSQTKHLILNKKFTVSDDFKTVIFDNMSYKIPDFFNKENIKNQDTKTWEMIFYQIFSDNVSKSILKFKELYRQNKHNKTCEEYATEAEINKKQD